ncbi:MAG: 2-vinyl bacteriochlorophyllide hydratase [Chloroflexi bacterium]|uniref:2-vinyl bacteriochlorophyllide hydratase n=1 Tax=Candidatus Chlorohelix allophototropha TaxID=3003348 RepID=A0A8T7M1M4_9CHLR|nr:2-vinyl bacteriochlorophyllide hydratase [Chloroflexota bacterium]WJW66555.1 2-vinyl bacteriochlorophyllide hydratase [Chloroflexota bacterium L227-S17]
MSTYTPEQYARRANSVWTKVQIWGAPFQFLVFLISLGFVIGTFFSDSLFDITNATIIFKILFLYFMCITGMFWEKDVFDHWYFAPQFFWEDFITTIVMVAHSIYLVALLFGVRDHKTLLLLVVIAYVSYLLNAAQYVLKWLVNRQHHKKRGTMATLETVDKPAV